MVTIFCLQWGMHRARAQVDTKRCFLACEGGLMDRIGEEAVFWLLFTAIECVVCGRNEVLRFVDLCKQKAQKFVPSGLFVGQSLTNINNTRVSSHRVLCPGLSTSCPNPERVYLC